MAMIDQAGVDWLNIFEPEGVALGSVARLYQIQSGRNAYLIDRDGRIANREVRPARLADALDRLAGRPAPDANR